MDQTAALFKEERHHHHNRVGDLKEGQHETYKGTTPNFELDMSEIIKVTFVEIDTQIDSFSGDCVGVGPETTGVYVQLRSSTISSLERTTMSTSSGESASRTYPNQEN